MYTCLSSIVDKWTSFYWDIVIYIRNYLIGVSKKLITEMVQIEYVWFKGWEERGVEGQDLIRYFIWLREMEGMREKEK